MARTQSSGSKVTLRPLRVSDAGALGRVLRDGHVTRYLPPRVRRESGKQFVTRVLEETARDKSAAFAIVELHGSEPIGQIRFVNWSRSERRAEIGFWMGRRFWGRGYGTEAVRLICRFGFQTLSLHRIDAAVVVGNIASRRVLEKCGFRCEGSARLAARLSHGWVDEWRFGLIRHERGLSGLPGDLG